MPNALFESVVGYKMNDCHLQSGTGKTTGYLYPETLSKTKYYWNKKNVGLAFNGLFLHSFFI